MIEIDNVMTELIFEIEMATQNYVFNKLEFELKKSEMWLNTDFSTVLNKAKPTQKDKEAYIKVELIDMEREVEEAKINLEKLKRVFKVKLVELQDE